MDNSSGYSYGAYYWVTVGDRRMAVVAIGEMEPGGEPQFQSAVHGTIYLAPECSNIVLAEE